MEKVNTESRTRYKLRGMDPPCME